MKCKKCEGKGMISLGAGIRGITNVLHVMVWEKFQTMIPQR